VGSEMCIRDRWYWCNVFMERYSSAVESKSRKDYLEMTKHWLEGGPRPEVFSQAQTLIGAPGFRIRGSASYASAVYSGVFCLLALRNARDWRRAEEIRLQELQDHHIFPQAYLNRHGISAKGAVNTIANRTLISDETNGKISGKAPADYLADQGIFPSGPRLDLLEPHFINELAIVLMQSAVELLPKDQAGELYQRFLSMREAAIVSEIRRACGITEAKDSAPIDQEADVVAADLRDMESPESVGVS